MPLMGKDINIEEFRWLRETGLTEDQFGHVWTYAEGEDVPESGEFRDVISGATRDFREGDLFPDGRWVESTALPAPRYKHGSASREITE